MCSVALLATICTFVFAESVAAHGYVESPASRAYLCSQGINTDCGPIQYEPQSLEGQGSFPEYGPADGEITGAGVFTELFEQRADRWEKVTINGGMNAFTWRLTAPHSTAEWKYYITKKDWDPNRPLARADLELFCYFNDGGSRPPARVVHECDVPTDRSGYHLILGVWEIGDTDNAFYNVIDIHLVNEDTGEDVPLPLSAFILQFKPNPVFSLNGQLLLHHTELRNTTYLETETELPLQLKQSMWIQG
nr:lytic polysaccharide monooxygenase [Caldalkalibacillus mannanilyticus]